MISAPQIQPIFGSQPSVPDSSTLVFLAGGRGTRFRVGPSVPKHLQEVMGIPILVRLIHQFGSGFDVRPVVVLGEEDSLTPEVLSRWRCDVDVVRQKGHHGTVPAMLSAAPLCDRSALFVLADLVFQGEFGAGFDEQPRIGVWREGPSAAVTENFGVICRDSVVVEVVEKPRVTAGFACGVGVYHLPTEMLVEYAPAVQPDGRGDSGVTELLSVLIGNEIPLGYLGFEGMYWNINRSEDLAEARKVLQLR